MIKFLSFKLEELTIFVLELFKIVSLLKNQKERTTVDVGFCRYID